MANSPAEITVIYPMIELRGDPIAPLRSWTREQTLARERYRVIAVFAEADRAQAAAMEPLLGPNDELLPVPDSSFPALMNAGTARARTPWLMMTEGHCIAQPGALDEVMRWIEANPDAQIGNFELIHISRNIVNRMVARWYDETLAQWRASPNWEHAISAGFALRASVLDEVGPMKPAFGAFAPFVQSARLHSRGVKVAHVPGAAVLHLDERSMAQFYDSTKRYARGEFIARSQIDSAFMERYFGDSHLWTNRARLDRETAGAMMRAMFVAVRTSPKRSAALAGAFASLLGEAVGGLRLRIALNRLMLAFYAMAIERLPIPDETHYRHFLRSHQRAVRLAQLQWLHENPMSPAAALAEGRRAVDELGPGDIVGVHGREEFQGRRFRWTEPVAMIRIAPRQTACELRLETGGIRGDPLASLIAVVIAGRALPGKYCTSDDKGTLTIHLPAAFAAGEPSACPSRPSPSSRCHNTVPVSVLGVAEITSSRKGCSQRTDHAPMELRQVLASSSREYDKPEEDHRSMKHAQPASMFTRGWNGWPSGVAGRYGARCSGGACEIARPGCRRERHSAGAGECARIKRLDQRSERHRQRGPGAGDPAAGHKPGDAAHGVAANRLANLAGAARGEDQTHAICNRQIPPRGQGNRPGTRGQSNRQ